MNGENKYPMLRLFLGMSKTIYIAILVITTLGGFFGGCASKGVGGGVLGLVSGAILGAIIYFFGMIWVEFIQVFLDIEKNTRS